MGFRNYPATANRVASRVVDDSLPHSSQPTTNFIEVTLPRLPSFKAPGWDAALVQKWESIPNVNRPLPSLLAQEQDLDSPVISVALADSPAPSKIHAASKTDVKTHYLNRKAKRWNRQQRELGGLLPPVVQTPSSTSDSKAPDQSYAQVAASKPSKNDARIHYFNRRAKRLNRQQLG